MLKKIFAHRGASAYAPENTLPAFEKAVDICADGVELDIHLSRDSRLVVIHDEMLDRTTNGHGFVKDFTLAELKKLDASAIFVFRPSAKYMSCLPIQNFL